MKAGFILLEAVIAVLIIAAVSIAALDTVRMMNDAVLRFERSSEKIRARQNSIAILRHVAYSSKIKAGVMRYGPYEMRWRSTNQITVTKKHRSVVGEFFETTYVLHRLEVATRKAGQLVDIFSVSVVGN